MKLLITLIAMLFIFILTCNVYSTTVSLKWDHNTETDLAGYNVFMKINEFPYNKIGTTTLNTYTTGGLVHPIGTYLYFVVTAFNIAGLESGYSNVVSVYRPGIPAIAIPELISKP